MKIIGIDYGTKRVGVAVSDDSGSVAFPKAVFPNDRTLIPTLVSFIKKENADEVIVGESRNSEGAENPVMKNIRHFAQELAREADVAVMFEPEFYSSVEARRFEAPGALVDAKAAAIILNSYLARKAHGNLA